MEGTDKRQRVATLLADRDDRKARERWKEDRLAELRRLAYDPVGAALSYRGVENRYHRWDLLANLRKRTRPPVEPD
jgi:hypothetical protein